MIERPVTAERYDQLGNESPFAIEELRRVVHEVSGDPRLGGQVLTKVIAEDMAYAERQPISNALAHLETAKKWQVRVLNTAPRIARYIGPLIDQWIDRHFKEAIISTKSAERAAAKVQVSYRIR